MKNIVLASSSKYRQAILSKLQLKFTSVAPDVDESEITGESPQDLVVRLAEKKAKAVAHNFPKSLIIGSDQVAVIGNQILTKPGSFDVAKQQLTIASGKSVIFFTGLCLYNAITKRAQVDCVPFKVHFRNLNEQQIVNYLQAEEPYDSAGSFKSEGFGISLFKKLEGDDPNTLIGLPLIRLIEMFSNEGIQIP